MVKNFLYTSKYTFLERTIVIISDIILIEQIVIFLFDNVTSTYIYNLIIKVAYLESARL